MCVPQRSKSRAWQERKVMMDSGSNFPSHFDPDSSFNLPEEEVPSAGKCTGEKTSFSSATRRLSSGCKTSLILTSFEKKATFLGSHSGPQRNLRPPHFKAGSFRNLFFPFTSLSARKSSIFRQSLALSTALPPWSQGGLTS